MDRALKGDGYLLEAQPIRDLATGDVSRYELPIRIRGIEGDVIPPAGFLYVAERFGRSAEIRGHARPLAALSGPAPRT
jgi:EAL domain-containing protein (putative c-di-GMP-specific phosphodiesterase class I)